MTTGPVQINPEDNAPDGSSYETVRADDSIQYSPIDTPPDPERDMTWLDDFFRSIGEFFEPVGRFFGGSWPVVKWVLLAAGLALLLIILWRLLKPVLDLKTSGSEAAEEWAPEEAEALALLEEADSLAAAGNFDDATHLLLKRSVGQIAQARPELVDPSSTARELSVLPSLPESARTAFSTIAERVERSLFALRKLDAHDWQAARDAYAKFALQRLTGDAS